MRGTLCLVLGTWLIASHPVEAATIPVGVLNDIAYNTVVNDWGWSVAYRGGGDEAAALQDLFGAVQAGDYLMLASIRHGSDTFDVLAAALETDVMTFTAQDVAHQANGASWYFNAVSIGFAGAGDSIYQSDIDIMGRSERDRLSWNGCALAAPKCNLGHDVSLTYPLLGIGTSSRSGADYNASAGWDRVVLVAHTATPVPEPSTLLLTLSGFGWGLRRLVRRSPRH